MISEQSFTYKHNMMDHLITSTLLCTASTVGKYRPSVGPGSSVGLPVATKQIIEGKLLHPDHHNNYYAGGSEC